MSTFLYRSAQDKFDAAEWSWTELPLRAALLTANYTADRDHVTLDEVPADSIVVRDVALIRLRDTDALAKGVIPTLEALLDQREIIALLLYTHAPADEDAELIYYSSDGFGFPWLAQGLDYSVGYRQENGGFFQL